MSDKISELTNRYPALESCSAEIKNAINVITECYKSGGKVMICGNGGSAADSTHIVGELMKGFLKKRPVEGELKSALKKNCDKIDDTFLSNLQCGLSAVNLCESSALLTAFCNDVNPDFIYAQEVFGLGKNGDVFIGISTSGNANNVNNAAVIAKAMGIATVGLTGAKGGKLLDNCDICICVPEAETFKVQELHLPVYHCICAAVEEEFFVK